MRSKGRRVHRRGMAALGAILALGVVVSVAGTHSTLHAPKAGTLPLVAPEHEMRLPGQADPNEYLDLKQSSAQPVTVAQVRRMQAQAEDVPAAASGIHWQQLGPYNIGGRVVDVVADKKAPNAVYAAASGGGVWHSTDGGASWTPVWPAENVQTMGSLAEDANGTLWAGTGEANPPGGGLTYFGDGIYKSTDGGAHWTNMGLHDSASIGRIAIDATHPDTVFAAATGHIARSVPERGLYRTRDGGATWQRVLAPINASTGAVDVAIDPTDHNRVYATMWDHIRNNGARTYGGVGSGLYRSLDGGDTWTRLENIVDPLPAYDQAQTGLKSDKSLGRIGVTVANGKVGNAQFNRIYVVSGSPYGPDKGFYWSDDGGDSFHVGARAYQTSSGYQWWFGRLWVDPEDPLHIFNADVNLRTSLNGGTSWAAVNGPHSDQHGMDWDMSMYDGNPATPMRVWLGNDGGMYRSDTSGRTVPGQTTWVKPVPAGKTMPEQPWNQSYHLDVAKDDPQRLVTGLQDNGSQRTWTPADPSPTDPELRIWNSYGGGDGHWTLIDPKDSSYYYECFQPSPPSQSCRGFHDVGATTEQIPFDNQSWPADQRWTTDTPIAIDPNNDAVVYLGGTVLGRSANRGINFTMISPDGPNSLPGPVPPGEDDLGPFYKNEYATISAIAPAKSKTPVPYAQTMYVGTDTGRVWKTTDAGGHWTWLKNGLPERWVNALVVDPDDENHVYAAFSGYREGDDAANVYETHDGGATWTNISQNLPNGPVEMITYDAAHNVLFAATDVGVFDHKDNDAYWYKVSIGVPQVPVLDVKLSGDGKYLFAATFGRSVWKLPLFVDATDGGGPGAGVPATLSLNLGPSASFGAFQPGVAKDYTASTTANVISTAGDAQLSIADPSSTATGHLVNGAFSLPQPLKARGKKADTQGTAFNNVGALLNLLTWSAPVSNDPVTIEFHQSIAGTDPLRTGTYSKTLTFTLSTTNP
jgi:photosystem II stability/assembly factor-like uncharacterized protein